MTEILPAVVDGWQATTNLEIVSVLFGLAYVILAAREDIWCWPAALIGTGTAILLFWDVSLLMESALNVYYLAMALYGWWHWQRGGPDRASLPITSWRWRQHALTLVLIAVLTLVSGSLLTANTQAALPYVDSFTTWAAVITTWMVTQKILENWLYWIVIDAVSIWLYAERGLMLYAALFAGYTIIAVFGYVQWRRNLSHG
ncbi:MAG: nicotinamide mononucleotide transporter [Gammaproteobacteria bacterium]|nr:nicotinamide mononucleotide transporter [Gammaproteobacteria bacterium]